MEVFSSDSEGLVKATRKINRLKLASLLILITSIFLIVFNIVLGIVLYKHNDEITQRIRSLESVDDSIIALANPDLNRTFDEIEDRMKIEDRSIETVNKKLSENFVDVIKRIDALETVISAKDNISLDQKLGEILNEIESKMKDEKKAISETIYKNLTESIMDVSATIKALESIISAKDNISFEFIYQILNETRYEIEESVEHKDQVILETINKNVEKTSKEIIRRIEHSIPTDVIYKELNKTIVKTNKNVDELELQLHYKKMFSLEQNSYCLDTMHRTENEHLELYDCHGNGHNQEWQLTINGELKNRKSCVTFNAATEGVMINPCNGSEGQKWKFSASVIRNVKYDICLESNEMKINAAKCNPAATNQIFKTKPLYTIDRICTFKQGTYVLSNMTDCILATNGYLLCNNLCLAYDNAGPLLFKICEDVKTRKWNYNEHGQIMNPHENVCVVKEKDKILAKKCDLNVDLQRWLCV